MIFVLDNGLDYDEHALIFVKAGPEFEAWLLGPFEKWRRYHRTKRFTIVATAQEMEFRDADDAAAVEETAEEFWTNVRDYLGPGGPNGEGRFADPPPWPDGAK